MSTAVLRSQQEKDIKFFEVIKRWPSDEAKQWVHDFVEKSRSSIEIKAIVVFGSVVRNTDFSADIDLLVIYSKEKLLISPPIDVDIRAYHESNVDVLIKEGNEVLGWAIRFGRILHEKNQYWTKICRQWKGCLSLPSALEAERRAEKAEKYFNELQEMGDVDAANEQLTTMLTQLARAYLIRKDVFPISRPELPNQLNNIGETEIAIKLSKMLENRKIN